VILSLPDGLVVDLHDIEDAAYSRLAELVATYEVRPRDEVLRDIVEVLCAAARSRYESDPRGAVAHLTTALELAPYLRDRSAIVARLYGLRAYVRATMGDPSAALADYDAAIETAPTHATYRNNRSVCRRQVGDLRGALEDSLAAVAENTQSGLYWLTLAEAYAALENEADAALAVRHALQLNPSLGRQLDPALRRWIPETPH